MVDRRSPRRGVSGLGGDDTDSGSDRGRFLSRLHRDVSDMSYSVRALVGGHTGLTRRITAIGGRRVTGDPATRGDGPVFCHPRHRTRMLGTIVTHGANPVTSRGVTHLFHRVVSIYLSLRTPRHVTFLNPINAFARTTTLGRFNGTTSAMPVAAVASMFHRIRTKATVCNIIPIRGSSRNIIGRALSNFLSSALGVVKRIRLPVRRGFLITRRAGLSNLDHVCSRRRSLTRYHR